MVDMRTLAKCFEPSPVPRNSRFRFECDTLSKTGSFTEAFRDPLSVAATLVEENCYLLTWGVPSLIRS